MLDCTTDISRSEQMTIVLRYVFLNELTRRYEVRESFVEFLQMFEKTGLGISDAALNKLESFGLDLEDLRGQGYDNGSSMKGKNIGVQKRTLDKFPRAFFVPCSNHSLNLAVNEAASATGTILVFFSLIEEIFTFLSGSSNRWDIMKSHVTAASILTLKILCQTRWSSRIDAIKPLRFNLGNIIAALNEIKETVKIRESVRNQAESIIKKIDYKFICFVCMWYDILNQINIASKSLQTIESNLQSALLCLESVEIFLEEYTILGIEIFFREATEMCESLGIEPVFTDGRKRVASGREINSEEQFHTNYFYNAMEVAKNSIHERFESIKKHNAIFSFLYNFDNFEQNRQNGNLLSSCKELENALSSGEQSDVDGDELFSELSVVANFVRNQNVVRVIDILNAIAGNGMENLLPNAVIAYRIFLTSPVSVATGERSFSKLKIIKSYLRNSLSQEKLNGLAIISIENEVASAIEYDEIIDDFAAAKARKGSFY